MENNNYCEKGGNEGVSQHSTCMLIEITWTHHVDVKKIFEQMVFVYLLLGPGKRKSLKLSTKKVTLFSTFRQLVFIFIPLCHAQ